MNCYFFRLTLQNLPTVLEFTNQHGLEDMRVICMNAIIEHFDEFPSHTFLTVTEMITCLSSDWLNVKDEVVASEALLAFIGMDPSCPGNLRELFNCIRLDYLPREYIIRRLVNHPLIRLSDHCMERAETFLNDKLPKLSSTCRIRRSFEHDRLLVVGRGRGKRIMLLNERGGKWECVKDIPNCYNIPPVAIGCKSIFR